jgi:hypothetical protein
MVFNVTELTLVCDETHNAAGGWRRIPRVASRVSALEIGEIGGQTGRFLMFM